MMWGSTSSASAPQLHQASSPPPSSPPRLLPKLPLARLAPQPLERPRHEQRLRHVLERRGHQRRRRGRVSTTGPRVHKGAPQEEGLVRCVLRSCAPRGAREGRGRCVPRGPRRTAYCLRLTGVCARVPGGAARGARRRMPAPTPLGAAAVNNNGGGRWYCRPLRCC